MPVNNDYIPARDAQASPYFTAFAAVLTASAASYGLTAADALDMTNKATDFATKLALATDSNTRSSVTVAAKDESRITCEALCRALAAQIQGYPAITPALLTAIGLRVRATSKTPVPAPTASPILQLVNVAAGVAVVAFSSTENPGSKRKPEGVLGVVLERKVGSGPWEFVGQLTKSPSQFSTAGVAGGTQVQLRAKFATRSGPGGVAQYGPLGAEVSFFAQ